MALNYDDLVASKTTVGSIAYWMNWTLADAAGAMEDAQAFIYGLLRTREMRASATLVVTQGNATVALPASFLEPKALWNPRTLSWIKQTDERALLQMRSVDSDGALIESTLIWYSIYDEVINFDAKSDAAVSLPMIYMKRPANLSTGAGATNWLTTRYPNIVRAAALGHAWQQRINDTESEKWLGRAAALIGAANAEADLSLMGADYPIEVRDG